MNVKQLFLFLLLFNFSLVVSVYSSDLSDANALRKRCEKEASKVQIAVKNFGDQADNSTFQSGSKLIKIGKLRLAQSKYKDAINSYKEYLKIQNSLYQSLANKYLTRTETIINDVTSELVDYIDNQKINKYFKLASQYHRDGKQAMTRKHYTQVIQDCRRAKEYVINSYSVANQSVPEKYNIDVLDIKYQTK